MQAEFDKRRFKSKAPVFFWFAYVKAKVSKLDASWNLIVLSVEADYEYSVRGQHGDFYYAIGTRSDAQGQRFASGFERIGAEDCPGFDTISCMAQANRAKANRDFVRYAVQRFASTSCDEDLAAWRAEVKGYHTSDECLSFLQKLPTVPIPDLDQEYMTQGF